MVDLTILSSELTAVDSSSFPPIDSLSSTTDHRCGPTGPGAIGCETRDQVTWTPELWWLLNWWTWLFPPPDAHGIIDARDCAGLYVVDHIAVESADKDEQSIGLTSTLAMASDRDRPEAAPPDQMDTVHRVINLGNGLIDLFA